MANGSANGLAPRRGGRRAPPPPPPAAPRSRRRRRAADRRRAGLRTSPAPMGSLSRLTKVPLVEVSASCQAPPRNATAKCRLDSSRSGSGSTQSTPGPRPTENSPPVTVRVSGATVSGQRRTVMVSCMVSAAMRPGRRFLDSCRLGGQPAGAARGDITPTFKKAAQSIVAPHRVAAHRGERHRAGRRLCRTDAVRAARRAGLRATSTRRSRTRRPPPMPRATAAAGLRTFPGQPARLVGLLTHPVFGRLACRAVGGRQIGGRRVRDAHARPPHRLALRQGVRHQPRRLDQEAADFQPVQRFAGLGAAERAAPPPLARAPDAASPRRDRGRRACPMAATSRVS